MDLFFYLFVAGSWMTTTTSNFIWNNMKGAHGFAIFCSVVITILKVDLYLDRSPYFISYGLFESRLRINE